MTHTDKIVLMLEDVAAVQKGLMSVAFFCDKWALEHHQQTIGDLLYEPLQDAARAEAAQADAENTQTVQTDKVLEPLLEEIGEPNDKV